MYYGDNEQISVTAKMLDVQTGTLLWAGEGTGDLKGGLAVFGGGLLGAGAGATTGWAIARTPGAIIGGVAGALAGGTAGAVLQPDTEQLLRSVIEKTCRDLPARTQAGAAPNLGPDILIRERPFTFRCWKMPLLERVDPPILPNSRPSPHGTR